MANDNPNGPNGDSNGCDEPGTECHEIALATETFRKSYETSESNRAQHDSKTLFWARVTGIGVGIYTFLTLAIVCAAIYSAKQAKISADAANASANIAEIWKNGACELTYS